MITLYQIQGKIYSKRRGKLKELKPWLDGKKNYLMITLCGEQGHKKELIHRLVAQAFIPNPNGYTEVNHINYIKTDNRVENLEWCTRRDNNLHSFKKHSQIRNFKECKLLKSGKLIKECKSVAEASRLAKQLYNISESSIARNRKVKDIEIIA